MNSFFLKTVILSCWIFLTFKAHAEVLRWPQICLSGKLQIKNRSQQPTQIWLQKFSPSLTDETEMTLAGNTSKEIAIQSQSESEHYALLHFKNKDSVQAVFQCENKSTPASSVEGGLLTFRRSYKEKNVILIQNLFFEKNNLSIEYLDWHMQVLKKENLVAQGFEKLNYQALELKQDWNFIRIGGDNRFMAFKLNLNGASEPDQVDPNSSLLDPEAKYFMVSDRVNPADSFIIKVTDPVMISKAREQITQPALEKIVFAKVQKGHGGFNRNWLKVEKSFWSWSAAEVTNISDLGSTSCNGLPQAVEDRVELWLHDPGRICFWSYRIKKELLPSEISTGIQIP